MFKKSKNAQCKALLQLVKKGHKDLTSWCTHNIPCDPQDIVQVSLIEFAGNPPRMISREVDMVGQIPFSMERKDLSGCIMDMLDMRRVVLEGKTTIEREVTFQKAVLVRTSFRGSHLAKVCFADANLKEATMNSCMLLGCDFRNAILEGCRFLGANLEMANLRELKAPGADFSYAVLEFSDLSESWFCSKAAVNLSLQRGDSVSNETVISAWQSAQFCHSRLKGADMRKSHLCGASFVNANLTCAALQEADLRGANFENAKLCGANLSRANLQGVRNLDKADLSWVVVLGGVTIASDMLSKHKDAAKILSSQEAVEKWRKELKDVNFTRSDLSNYNMEGSHLPGCIFRRADLRHSNFSGSNLIGANFSGAEMYGADLSGCQLMNAVFKDADMRTVNISGTNLTQIQNSLLDAKTIVGMTCTLGSVPDVLKDRGVVDKARARALMSVFRQKEQL